MAALLEDEDHFLSISTSKQTVPGPVSRQFLAWRVEEEDELKTIHFFVWFNPQTKRKDIIDISRINRTVRVWSNSCPHIKDQLVELLFIGGSVACGQVRMENFSRLKNFDGGEEGDEQRQTSVSFIIEFAADLVITVFANIDLFPAVFIVPNQRNEDLKEAIGAVVRQNLLQQQYHTLEYLHLFRAVLRYATLNPSSYLDDTSFALGLHAFLFLSLFHSDRITLNHGGMGRLLEAAATSVRFCTDEMATFGQLVVFWGFVGQIFTFNNLFHPNRKMYSPSDCLPLYRHLTFTQKHSPSLLLDRQMREELIVAGDWKAWLKSPGVGSLFYLAQNALKLTLSAVSSAAIPPFETLCAAAPLLTMMGVVSSASELDVASVLTLNEGPAPDFSVQIGDVRDRMERTIFPPSAPETLQRSMSLEQRETAWYCAMTQAEMVVAKTEKTNELLNQELQWLDKACRSLQEWANSNSNRETMDEETRERVEIARQRATESLQALVETVEKAKEEQLHLKVTDMRHRGLAIHRNILNLIHRFGADLGVEVSAEEFYVSTIAGDQAAGCADGWARTRNDVCGALAPNSCCQLPNGTIIFCETRSNTIRGISVQGMMTTYGGHFGAGFTDGEMFNARFRSPSGVCVWEDGSVIVADTANHVIRMISPDMMDVVTISGSPGIHGNVDGNNPLFFSPTAVAYAPGFGIVVADTDNHCIRRISGGVGPRSRVSTLAGTGKEGVVDTSSVAPALLSSPHSLLVVSKPPREEGGGGGGDGGGGGARRDDVANENMPDCILFCDTASVRCLYRVQNRWRVSSIVGGGGAGQARGNINGPVAKAQVGSPHGLALLPGGIIMFTDVRHHTIRLILPLGLTPENYKTALERNVPPPNNLAPLLLKGTVITVAGLPTQVGDKDGIGSCARFSAPTNLCALQNGGIAICDPLFGRLRCIFPPSSRDEASRAYAASRQEVEVQTVALEEQVKACNFQASSLAQAIQTARANMQQCQLDLVGRTYDRKVEEVFSQLPNEAFSLVQDYSHEIIALIVLAPTVPSLCAAICKLAPRLFAGDAGEEEKEGADSSSRSSSSLKKAVRAAIKKRIERHRWSQEIEQQQTDATVLLSTVESYPQFFDPEIICSVLSGPRFRLRPDNSLTLSLLNALLLSGKPSAGKPPVKSVQTAIAVWQENFTRNIITQTTREAKRQEDIALAAAAAAAAAKETSKSEEKQSDTTSAAAAAAAAKKPPSVMMTYLNIWCQFLLLEYDDGGEKIRLDEGEEGAGSSSSFSYPLNSVISLCLESFLRRMALDSEERASAFLVSLCAKSLLVHVVGKTSPVLPTLLVNALKVVGTEAVDMLEVNTAFSALIGDTTTATTSKSTGDSEEDSAVLACNRKLSSSLVLRVIRKLSLPTSMYSLLAMNRQSVELWIRILEQSSNLRQASVVFSGEELQKIGQKVYSLFMRGLAMFKDGSATIELVNATATQRELCVSGLTICYDRAARQASSSPPPPVSTLEEALSLLKSARQLVSEAGMDFNTLNKVVSVMFQESDEAAYLAEVSSHWQIVTLNDLRILLRYPQPATLLPSADAASPSEDRDEVSRSLSIPIRPIGEVFIQAASWLETVCQSQAFMVFLEQEKGKASEDSENDLSQVILNLRKKWQQLYRTLTDGSLKLGDLSSDFCALLSSSYELTCLATTGVEQEQEKESSSSPWTSIGTHHIPSGWIETTSTVFRNIIYLRRVHSNLKEILQVVSLLSGFISPAGRESSVAGVTASLEKMSKELSSRSLDDLCVSDLKEFAPLIARVDSRLVNLGVEVVSAIVSSNDFLEWLRTLQNDSDFTSSIEMAMGRSEMEVPPELWVQEDEVTGDATTAGPGHVNEELLSILTSVRRALHKFLYREDDLFDNLPLLLESMGTLHENVADQSRIAQSIRQCAQLLLPFSELLSDDSDSSAPNRLLSLMQESWKGRWMVQSNRFTSEDESVKLLFDLPRKSGSLLRQLTLPELLDFQSTVVLAKTASRTTEMREAIDEFVQQFGWVRELSRAVQGLRNASHFDFASFEHTFFVVNGAGAIKAFADRLRTTLEKWEEFVTRNRHIFPVVNTFSMAQISSIVESIAQLQEANEGKKDSPPHLAEFKSKFDAVLKTLSYRQSIRAQLGSEGEVEEDVAIKVWKLWCASSSSSSQEKGDDFVVGTTEAHQVLYRISKVLSEVFGSCKSLLPSRPITSRAGQQFIAAEGMHCTPGVHLVIAEGAGVVHSALSAYVRNGLRPEWHSLLFCSSSTTWEAVRDLLNRWAVITAASTTSQRHPFCLIHADSLQYEVQHKAVQLIHHLTSIAVSGTATTATAGATASSSSPSTSIATRAPLIIIATCEQEFIAAQFIHRRVVVPSLNVEALRHACDDPNLTVFASDKAGAGKSFTIRREAARQQMEYVHVPINRSLTCPELHQLLSDRLRAGDRSGAVVVDSAEKVRFLHIDIADNVDESLDSALFEILFMGCCTNTSTGERYFLTPRSFTIAIEIARPELFHLLHSVNILQCRVIQPSQDTFCARLEDLSQGFAAAAAAGELHSKNPSKEEEASSMDSFLSAVTAHRQLQHVAHALKHRKDANGFSFNAFVKQAGGDDGGGGGISGAECYQLILHASGQSENNVSLWSLWHFIRVFYSQLCDMCHTDSPVRAIFLPDSIPMVTLPPTIKTDDEVQLTVIQYQKLLMHKLLGEVIDFLARTASDFAMKQSRLVDPNRVEYIRLRGHSIATLNGYWRRAAFDNDGQFVFRENNRFLYFRGQGYLKQQGAAAAVEGEDTEGYWVIDTEIRPVGVYISRSLTANLHGVWQTPPPNSATGGGNQKASARPSTELDFTLTTVTAAAAAELWPSEAPPVALTPEEQASGNPLIDLRRWADATHESVIVSKETKAVSFLSLQPRQTWARMHPGLLAHLRAMDINVGEDLDLVNKRHHSLLSALTGVTRSEEEASKLMGGGFCLTGDIVLKLLAIFVRIQCGVPVLLLGECGIGKTFVIRYISAWLGAELVVLDVHGGTTEQDILNSFHKAKEIVTTSSSSSSKTCFVFLDEVNTCAHMGLISEVLRSRSLWGEKIHDGIRVLAACNPYRMRGGGGAASGGGAIGDDGAAAEPGLVYTAKRSGVGKGKAFVDPMANLVYRVHPIPIQMLDYIFDFGSLDAASEDKYILAMVRSRFPNEDVDIRLIITKMLSSAQQFIRNHDQDASAVSLRDVKRAIELIRWFRKALFSAAASTTQQSESMKRHDSEKRMASSAVLGIAHVYYFRLVDPRQRALLMDRLRVAVTMAQERCDISAFAAFTKAGTMEAALKQAQHRLCGKLQVESGIAMNAALMENLYVTLVCIFNRIPIFVVGKPGTSKTLTMQVLASNLQGAQSRSEFWRKFPAIYIFPYQCSPMSSAEGIRHQFQIACNYQAHADKTVTVLLLDEVGLAEHSPEFPLKVLHGILIDPPIAIVGLSNWVLDASKMNRACLLRRTEPAEIDIQLTGQTILSGAGSGAPTSAPAPAAAAAPLSRTASGVSALTPWLQPMSAAYHAVYSRQKGRDFIGMRDFYHLVKQLRACSAVGSVGQTEMCFALCRNFGGSEAARSAVLREFYSHCFGISAPTDDQLPRVTELIEANLSDQQSRHLMLLTRNGAALLLLFQSGLLSETNTMVLVGSQFRDDAHDLHLIQQINQVKLAMATGSTVVLLNHDNIYEALYDVLNQRYVVKSSTDGSGKQRKMLRLAIGTKSQLCQVEDGFKIVVIVEQDHAYENLDLPLLNRFEKQIFHFDDIISAQQKSYLDSLRSWVDKVVAEVGLDNTGAPAAVFCGFHEGTLASLVVEVLHGSTSENQDDLLDAMCRKLALTALPVAILHSQSLKQALSSSSNFDNDFGAVISEWMKTESIASSSSSSAAAAAGMLLLMTQSPLSHLNHSLFESEEESGEGSSGSLLNSLARWMPVRLSEFSSEMQFSALVQKFFSSSTSSATLATSSSISRVGSISRTASQKKAALPAILVVQCDPVHSKQELIDHARLIVSQQRAMWLSSATATDNGPVIVPHHVVFVIHLPPGARARSREFLLDFRAGWDNMFLDDIRVVEKSSATATVDSSSSFVDSVELASRTGERVPTLTLLQSSLADLFGSGAVDLEALIMHSIPGAVAALSAPSLEHGVFEEESGQQGVEGLAPVNKLDLSYSHRIRRIRAELEKRSDFFQLIKGCVLAILDQNRSVGKSGMHLHVELAVGQMASGTLRASTTRVVEAIIVVAVATSLRYLDTNFNLNLVGESNAHWLALARSKTIFDASSVAAQCRLDSKMQVKETLNTGLHHPLVGRFPFSAEIIALAGDRATLQAIEDSSSSSLSSSSSERVRSIAESLDGLVLPALDSKEVVETIENLLSHSGLVAYLHDVVSSTSSGHDTLDIRVQIRILQCLLKVSGCIGGQQQGKSASTLSLIHSLLWVHEQRISDYYALVSRFATVREQSNLLDAVCEKAASCSSVLELDDIVLNCSVSMLRSSYLSSSSSSIISLVLNLSVISSAVFNAQRLYSAASNGVKDSTKMQWHLLSFDADIAEEFLSRIQLAGKDGNAASSVGVFISNIPKLTSVFSTNVESLFDVEIFKKFVQNAGAIEGGDSAAIFVSSAIRSFVKQLADWGTTTLFATKEGDESKRQKCVQIVSELLSLVSSGSVPYSSSSTLSLELADRKGILQNLLHARRLRLPDPSHSGKQSRQQQQQQQEYSSFLHPILSEIVFQYVDASPQNTHMELRQLVLQYFEDKQLIEMKMKDQRGFAVSEVDRVSKATDGTAADSKELQLISFARVGLLCYAEDVLKQQQQHQQEQAAVAAAAAAGGGAAAAAGGAAQKRPGYVDTISVDVLNSNPMLRMFYLRTLLRLGGPEAVVSVLSDRRLAPWISAADSKLFSDTVATADLFAPVLFDRHQYDEVKLSLHSMLQRSAIADDSPLFSDLSGDALVVTRDVLALYAVIYRGKWREDHNHIIPPLIERTSSALRTVMDDFDATNFAAWMQSGCATFPVSRSAGIPPDVAAMNDFGIHLAMIALSHKDSWLYFLLTNPSAAKESFVPAMPDNDMAGVLRAMLQTGVRFYTCINGHRYTVGECTRPMEARRCYACNTLIGGHDHVSAVGNRALSDGEIEESMTTKLRGYVHEFSPIIRRGGYSLSPVTVRILRMIIHALLSIASFKHSLLTLDMNLSAAGVRVRMREDLNSLCSSLQLPVTDVGLLLQAVLVRLRGEFASSPLFWSTADRSRFEVIFEREIVSPILLQTGSRDRLLHDAHELASNSGAREILPKVLGPKIWESAREVVQNHLVLWRTRVSPSFEHISSLFERNPDNAKSFPILAAFLEVEKEMPFIRFIADILEWHRFLFHHLGDHNISRAEAESLSVQQFLDRFEGGGGAGKSREEGLALFTAFAHAFNSVLPRIEQLFECQDNPFLMPDGTLDLSGTKSRTTPMSLETPLCFSLPSQLPGSTDAPGLCTIQILAFLENVHNRVATQLLRIVTPPAAAAGEAGGVAAVTAAAAQQLAPAAAAAAPPAVAPTSILSVRTPPLHLRQKLLIYDRESDLTPLLFEFGNQPLSLGTGGHVNYDMGRIQQRLVQTVLRNCGTISVQARQFVYVGEMRQRGQLSALDVQIPQDPLPPAAQEALDKEVDTADQLTSLTAILERCIQLLTSVGGTRGAHAIDGSTLLEHYVLRVLHVSPASWESCCPRSVAGVVKLSHIRALFFAVDAIKSGGVMTRVLHRYREPLPEPEKVELLMLRSQFDRAAVVAVLHGLLVGPLSESDSAFAATESLRDFLIYADMDIQEARGFEHFPQHLQLMHALSVFQLLEK